MVSVDEAVDILLEKVNIERIIEEKNIKDIYGYIVAEDIVSDINIPPFDRSPYDGYCFCADENKKRYEVVQTIYAGDIGGKIESGECAAIMTGAAIPDGADTVIKKEDVKYIDGFIEFECDIKKGRNIVLCGEDVSKGEKIIVKGDIVDSGSIGVLAYAGIEKIKVFKRLSATIINTGSEVINPGNKYENGKIYNAGGYILYSKLKSYRVDVSDIVLCEDDIEKISDTIEKNMISSDIVITTGGVSVGDKDFMPEVIEKVGAKIIFRNVDIRPGGLCIAAVKNNKLIMCLSGNPTAAVSVFDSVISEFLNVTSGKGKKKKTQAIFKGRFDKNSKRDRYINGYAYIDDTKLYVRANDDCSRKARMFSGIKSNCTIRIKSGTKPVDGDIVDIIPFPEFI